MRGHGMKTQEVTCVDFALTGASHFQTKLVVVGHDYPNESVQGMKDASTKCISCGRS